ncbi:MAG: PaaI family thioesterase [Candidatus Acidiferrales bacterium]
MARPAKSKSLLAEKEMRLRLNQSNPAKQFGFDLVKAQRGRAVVRMSVADRHKQVHGVVHGGVIAALADTAGGMATYMAVPRGTRAATVELKINYLEAVADGIAVADARVIRLGRHIAVVDCDVRDGHRRLVAKALMTFFVGPFRKSRKRSR